MNIMVVGIGVRELIKKTHSRAPSPETALQQGRWDPRNLLLAHLDPGGLGGPEVEKCQCAVGLCF